MLLAWLYDACHDMLDSKALTWLMVNPMQTVWLCAVQSGAAAGAGCSGPAEEATGGGLRLLKGAELS